MDWTTLIVQVLGILAAGGIGTLASKSGRKKAASEAEIAATQARREEFELLRQQIELNQQQNLDLIKLMSDREKVHNEQIADKEHRFVEQTDRLRDVQRALVAANERELELTRELAQSNAQRDYWKLWHCRKTICKDGREPPNDILRSLRFDPKQAGSD